MDRNGVIIDGTKAGSAPCSSAADAQDFGPLDPSAQSPRAKRRRGDGANGVYFENFTVCNFLVGYSADSGNEIWWNGGDDGGADRPVPRGEGSYLSATSSYFGGNDDGRVLRTVRQ